MFLVTAIGIIAKTHTLYEDSYISSGESETIYGFLEQLYFEEYEEHFLEQENVEDVTVTNGLLGVLDLDEENIQTIFLTYDMSRYSYTVFEPESFTGALKSNEVLVPIDFRDNYDLVVGDEIEYSGTVFSIAGFYEDPICGSPFYHTKRVLLSNELYQELDDNVVEKSLQRVTFLNIDIENIEDLRTAIADLDESFDDSSKSVFAFNQYRLTSARTMVPRIILAVLILFSFFLLGIMSLVVRYAILAAIEEDYSSLGVMKAIGFKGINLTILLLFQYLFIVLVGMVIGLVGAYLLTPPIGTYLMATSGIVWLGSAGIMVTLIISLSFLVFVSLIVLSQTRKARKVKPIEAIVYGKKSNKEKKGQLSICKPPFSAIPISTRMGIKQLTSNVGQYLTLFILVIIFAFMMINISGLSNAFNSEESVAGILGYDINDLKIKISDADNISKYDVDELVEWIDERYSVKYYSIYDTNYEGYIDDSEIQLLGYTEFQASNIITGHSPQEADEIMISSGVSEDLEKSVGDTIDIALTKEGDTTTFTVVGINNQVYDMGQNITISESGLEKIVDDYAPTTFLLKIEQNEDIAGVVEAINNEYLTDKGAITISNERAVMIKRVEAIQTTLMSITIAVTIISLMLIALITFLVAMVVVHRETIHSGIMKSIGFTPRQLRFQFANRFILIAVLGTIIGTSLALALDGRLINLLFSLVNIAQIPSGVSNLLLIIIAGFIILATAFSAYYVSRRFKKVNVRVLLSD